MMLSGRFAYWIGSIVVAIFIIVIFATTFHQRHPTTSIFNSAEWQKHIQQVPSGSSRTSTIAAASAPSLLPLPQVKGDEPLASTSQPPPTQAQQIPQDEFPILAVSYSRAPGSKRCRGHVIHELAIPRPVSQWRAGTCVTLPRQAQCGVFIARKEDNCEARLYAVEACANGSESYVNTAAFAPQQQTIGGMWRSMWVRCGIEVPVVAELNAEALGISIKKKPGTV